MTTKVTVDAHAGWPILVVMVRGEPHMGKTVETAIVPALEKQDFYIHSGMRIISVEELPHNSGA